MDSPCVCPVCQVVPCQPGPIPARRLHADLASDPQPGHNPVIQGWGLGGEPARALAQGGEGVPVIARWALACKQGPLQWEPEVASRLASPHKAVPIPPTLQHACGRGMWLTPPLCCRPTPTTAKRSSAVSTCTASWPTSRSSSPSMTSGSCRLGPSFRPKDRRALSLD